ncbi:MAG: 50S ribosomal protein L6 [Acidobacteriota bacterium]
MSRIGKAPIELPSGAKFEERDGTFFIEGPKGKIEQNGLEGLDVEISGSTVTIKRQGDSGPEKAKHGLLRSLLNNAVIGVTEGFKKDLDIVGVGYRGEVKGREAHLALGFSHPVVYAIPDGVDVEIDKNNHITVSGVDKQRVGQVAAELRSLRKPDAYKGKGIRYTDERITLKVGKAAAGGG